MLHTLSCSLYLHIPHRFISFMMEQLQMNLQEPRNSWRLISIEVLSELPKTAGLVWDAEQTCLKHQPLWLSFVGSKETDPDGFMWNSCVFLQPPFPLLPACPQLPAPVKSTVLGWTHLSPDPVQNFLCSFKDKSPSLGEGLVRDEMQSSERTEWKVTAIPSRSIWTRHREDCMAWGMEQPSENSEGFTGLMQCSDLCPLAS